MSLTVDQLTAEAMRLPDSSRAELAERLVESQDVADTSELEKL